MDGEERSGHESTYESDGDDLSSVHMGQTP